MRGRRRAQRPQVHPRTWRGSSPRDRRRSRRRFDATRLSVRRRARRLRSPRRALRPPAPSRSASANAAAPLPAGGRRDDRLLCLAPSPPSTALWVWWTSHFFFVLCFAFFAFFVLGQPVTLIGVDCLMTIPFCASNRVGIFSLVLQRFPLAASAEYLPCGSVSSKLPTGASGTVWNVLLVMPALLMNVSPCKSSVTP